MNSPTARITSSFVQLPRSVSPGSDYNMDIRPVGNFASVVDAVRCAVEVQREMAGRNTDVPSDRAGREAKGYKRLPPERRAKVIEARRANPDAPQEHDCAVGWWQPVHSLADRTRSS